MKKASETLRAIGDNPNVLMIGGAIALMYIPCLSVFAILVKEFGVRFASVITFSTVIKTGERL